MLSVPTVALASLILANPAAGPTIPKDLPDELAKVPPAEDQLPPGWHNALRVGGLGAYNDSRNVIGTLDGGTTQLGVLLAASSTLVSGQHAWENLLNGKITLTRTPQLGDYNKSADELIFRSTWLYRVGSMPVGPYGRFRVSSPSFSGYDVRPAPVDLTRWESNGAVIGEGPKRKPAQKRLSLTGPFEPMIIKESTGVFANPIAETWITIKAKAGAAMQHIVVRDGFALACPRNAPACSREATTVNGGTQVTQLSFTRLVNSTQGGLETELELAGEIAQNISWGVTAGLFYPILTDVETDLTGMDLLNTDIAAKLSVKLIEWLSLDYTFSAKRTPLIVEDWQVQNGVVVAAGFDMK